VVANGEMKFDPMFLITEELLQDPQDWPVFNTSMDQHMIELPAQSTGSTVCQVPIVVVVAGDSPQIEAELSDGQILTIPGDSLGSDLSSRIFGRTGDVARVKAFIPLP